MEFKKDEVSKTYIESQLSDSPHINVIDKETFNQRIQEVFSILHDTLKRSFGPGGAGTFVSVYPSYYNTKDGFNIMKNIGWDVKLDQIISDMVMSVCSRMNFTVGDGTTTAVIATESIYNSYMNNRDFFKKHHILPREILKRLDIWKEKILKGIDDSSISIRSDDPDVLRENIKKVVSISSNNNEEITNMISDLYGQLMYPAISCGISKDGTMKSSIVRGYKIDVSLTDKLYINNDNKTAFINGADVIMFDHRVTKDTYQKIVSPLNESCRSRGRKLVCIAPYYDETALNGVIRSELTKEYNKTKDINLVLTVCKKATGDNKILLDDLAMLLHTTLISSSMETDIIEKIDKSGNTGNTIYEYFDIDNREIPDISVAVKVSEGHLALANYKKDLQDIFGEEWKNECIRVGYCDEADIGLNQSTFSGFYYDEEIYNNYLAIATDEYNAIRKKCETIGSFSFELVAKQKRLYSLRLNTGLIEVGASSELSQGYLKDTVDDAVKAAASAYNNGIVLGCNLSLIGIITNFLDNAEDEIDKALLSILYQGFTDVYRAVLSNVFEDFMIDDFEEYPLNDEEIKDVYNYFVKEFEEKSGYYNSFTEEEFNKIFTNNLCSTCYDLIINKSLMEQKVFDLTTGDFSDSVINSAETDKEILQATIDLLALLITGNQIVLQ